MGISGAYAARRRNPVFAAAWDAALSIARERLADTLLTRAIEGNVEQIYKDGELVGERRLLDNRLGLAILRRLDRLAETGVALQSGSAAFSVASRGPGTQRCAPAFLPRSRSFEWERMVEALRGDDLDEVARALALLEFNEVEEVEDPLDRPACDEEDGEFDLSDRCWKDDTDNGWMTDFPPPEGFAGYESGPYDDMDDDEPYVRACTDEEIAILEADARAGRAAERAEEEALRDQWFGMLREEAGQ